MMFSLESMALSRFSFERSANSFEDVVWGEAASKSLSIDGHTWIKMGS